MGLAAQQRLRALSIQEPVSEPRVPLAALAQNERVRFEIHVRPGASKAVVGGEYDGALVVRVMEPADGGRATEAALRAVSKALGVPRRSVVLVWGATSRRKLIEVATSGTDSAEASLALLRDPGDGGLPTRTPR
jgi:hypothetical protein